MQLANLINAHALARPMINEPRNSNASSPCYIAPPEHIVVVVQPALPEPAPQELPLRARNGPSLFSMLRVQRIRRQALRVWLAHKYTELQQQDMDKDPGHDATSTDADMV